MRPAGLVRATAHNLGASASVLRTKAITQLKTAIARQTSTIFGLFLVDERTQGPAGLVWSEAF